MCQVQESGDQPVVKQKLKFSKLCTKCDERAIIVVGTNGTFCRECFEKYFTHKFRASMGKNPIVRHGNKVAVAYSGGANSSALLNLIKDGLSPQAVRKLKFQAGVIFVDESCAYDGTAENSNATKEIESVLKTVGFPYHILKIESVFSFDNCYSSELDENEAIAPRERLRKLLSSCLTLTSKMELLSRLRLVLLSWKAKVLGYDHVFLGECCSRLAVNILTNVALGRGVHIPQDSGFSDENRFKPNGVNVLRPLRDITSKEIIVYNMIHKVQTVFIPNLSTEKDAMSSIQRLTEDFVSKLVAGYPATETTVFRTSNKLKAKQVQGNAAVEGYNNENNKKCLVCHGTIDCCLKPDRPSAVEDSLLSEGISSGKYLNNSDYSPAIALTVESSTLCHACRIMSRELTDSVQSMWPQNLSAMLGNLDVNTMP